MKIVNLIKELKWIITFFGVTSTSLIMYFNSLLEFVKMYSFQIALVGCFSITFFYMFLFSVLNFRIKTMEKDFNDNIETRELRVVTMIEDMHKDQLRYQVAELIKSLVGINEITNEITIKKIYDLEKTMIKLGVNSYTQDAINDMKSRIVFGKGKYV